MAPRWSDEGGQSATASATGTASRGEGPSQGQLKTEVEQAEDRLCEILSEPCAALTDAERAEVQAVYDRHREHWDQVYDALRLDAQACTRAMQLSPLLNDPVEPKRFEDVAIKSFAEFRSGKALMDQLGAGRLLDPATTGMLLAIRRGLIEESAATTMVELVLIDMAMVALANAMRMQAMIGNTACSSKLRCLASHHCAPAGRNLEEVCRPISRD